MQSAFFDQLYSTCHGAVHRYCAMQFHYDPAYMDTVEDIVHEVFIKAYREQQMLEKHPNPLGWLCVTCRNMCRSIIRRDLRRREITGRQIPLDACSEYAQCMDDLVRWAEAREDREALEALKKTLSENERQVYRCYYEEGVTDRETAERLGMTLSAVRSVLGRIRAKAGKQHGLLFLFLHPILATLRIILFEGRFPL